LYTLHLREVFNKFSFNKLFHSMYFRHEDKVLGIEFELQYGYDVLRKEHYLAT